METIHLIIKGKVQGVFYRVTAKEVADSLKLNGWVKNTRNGDVEILASGEREKLDEFISWCWQGPPKAKVDNVIITGSAEKPPEGFAIIR